MHFVIGLLVVAGVAWWWWSASNHLFRVDVVGGQVYVADGQPPGPVLEALRHMVRDGHIQTATVIGTKAEHGVRLSTSGLSEGQAQRLRNAHRLSPQASYRAAPNPVNEQNLTRAGGLHWLLRILLRR